MKIIKYSELQEAQYHWQVFGRQYNQEILTSAIDQYNIKSKKSIVKNIRIIYYRYYITI